MNALLSIGSLLILLCGIVPLQHWDVWLTGAPVCRMACAGTDHCCCKRRQEARRSGWIDRADRPVVRKAPDGPSCPDNCAAASAGQRVPPTKPAFNVEVVRPAPHRLLGALPSVCSLKSGLIGPTRPRAPPA